MREKPDEVKEKMGCICGNGEIDRFSI